ncbi:hypothetical protein [Rathayibacter festucae]|uniref:hypothetical protein n=1 Tax=Rathayibacter festucae TaxID=110937 RepID=UPI002A6B7C5D|nr:hypothetical protein [Rathayibacter festucae]
MLIAHDPDITNFDDVNQGILRVVLEVAALPGGRAKLLDPFQWIEGEAWLAYARTT